MNQKIIFKKGVEVNLPASTKENELLFVEDIGKIFKGAGVDLPLISFSDVIGGFKTLEDLKTKNPAKKNKIYITDDGVLAFYNGTTYVSVIQGEAPVIAKCVADIAIQGATMTVTYSDSTTKELTIQGSGPGVSVIGYVSETFGATEW